MNVNGIGSGSDSDRSRSSNNSIRAFNSNCKFKLKKLCISLSDCNLSKVYSYSYIPVWNIQAHTWTECRPLDLWKCPISDVLLFAADWFPLNKRPPVKHTIQSWCLWKETIINVSTSKSNCRSSSPGTACPNYVLTKWKYTSNDDIDSGV